MTFSARASLFCSAVAVGPCCKISGGAMDILGKYIMHHNKEAAKWEEYGGACGGAWKRMVHELNWFPLESVKRYNGVNRNRKCSRASGPTPSKSGLDRE
ncbi:hypothetical protein FEM48_Zijuj01G0048900 [Ziziphus jujuba var. spinosa]|uniref:Uncharacterized protein n=1 Tax=Ziziphus jujuba var. spinosa TaxID=714518 RepID=A0A978VZ83_ZIZJJ|nr:hypothetical protein FEM48_Zijuj01G0048900 [Ziziphus jujuba var. spinosa]